MHVLDDAVPPVVSCAVCGKAECPGCAPASASEPTPVLAWEGEGTWGQRLWTTALESSTAPRRTFGEMPDGALGPALLFAFIAESLAVGSVAATGVLAIFALAPAWACRVFFDPAVGVLVVVGVLSFIALLVALHVLWGLCLEAGAMTTDTLVRWRLGVRFGLYACGWDLLTSPAGVLQGLASRGPKCAWGPLGAATRTPRVAMRSYMVDRRQFDPGVQRRATIIAASILGGFMLLFVLGLLWLAVRVSMGLIAISR